MHRRIHGIWLIIAAIAGGCIYSESGIYRVVPEPGEAPVLQVMTNLDTLVSPEVTDSLEVTYAVDIQNGEFYLMEALVSGDLIFRSDTTRDRFWIISTDAGGMGTDTLYMRFYYSTNSNSLADIVGIEAHVKELEYPVEFKGWGYP